MRLIDGDALMEHVYRDRLDSRELIAEMVRNAPTIEPGRKTGRWVSVGCVVPGIANVPMIKCTVCGHLEPDVDAARTPYCSHCGSFNWEWRTKQ